VLDFDGFLPASKNQILNQQRSQPGQLAIHGFRYRVVCRTPYCASWQFFTGDLILLVDFFLNFSFSCKKLELTVVSLQVLFVAPRVLPIESPHWQ
jgi:hypothetical protein